MDSIGSMSPHQIARIFGGDVSNGWINVPAPGHSANDRSLGIKLDPAAADGFRVNARATGDDEIACRDYVRSKLGMPPWQPKATSHSASKVTATYIYKDERSEPYLRVQRTNDKAFWQSHLDGGAWIKGKPQGPKIPYLLPAIIGSPATMPIFICEGEKDADRLASLQLIATTSSEGAGKWTADLNKWFEGRVVYILPDNDAVGRKHALDVARNLQGIAAQVRIVDLPGVPEKGDVSDWLDAGGRTDALVGLCDAAPIFDPIEADDVNDRAAERPLPLFPPLPPAEAFPVHALGSVLARAATAIMTKVQVPDAIAAQSVLAAASLAVQAHADVMMPYGQTRPLSLYFVTIAASGDRKTTTDGEALWPISKREKTLREEHAEAMRVWAYEYAAWTAERKKIEANRKLQHDDRKFMLAQLGEEPPKPLAPFLVTGDLTIEGLTKNWANAHAALGVFTAEGGTFTGGHGMSDENRLRTAAMLSEVWDGKPIKRVRAVDGITILPGRRLAMHVLVQPEAAATFLSNGVLRDQGLLSRVLVAAPNSVAGARFYKEPHPNDIAAIHAYGARLLGILEADAPLIQGTRNELEPRVLEISTEAKAIWREFYNHVEGQCGVSQELAQIGDFAAKIAEQAARIAGILTLVENLHARDIGREAMINAVALADWYVAEAVRLQRGARTDDRLLRAQVLLNWMQGQDGEIGFREILQYGPGSARTKAGAEESLGVLQAHGWLVETSARPRKFCVCSAEAT